MLTEPPASANWSILCGGCHVKGAWTGPAALPLMPHALAPVADLPVLEVVSAIHIFVDLTLGLGKVVHDDLYSEADGSSQTREMSLVD